MDKRIIGMSLGMILVFNLFGLVPIPGAQALDHGKGTSITLADASYRGLGMNSSLGNSTAIVGDVNGDGYDDMLIGAPNYNGIGPFSGEVYLIFGKPSGWTMGKSISTADVKFSAEVYGQEAGIRVAGAGDVNGDGYDDMLISAPLDDTHGTDTGVVYLILGKPSGWTDMSLGSADASFYGEAPENHLSWDVSGVGDVNGDGYDDFLLGSETNSQGGTDAGKVYLILGKSSGWGMNVNVSSAASATFVGPDALGCLGYAVGGAGDVNGDGLDDLLMAAYNDDQGGGSSASDTGAGQTWLFLGRRTGWTQNMPLTSANASFLGEDVADQSGNVIRGAGDVNGDGYDDFLIAAYNNDDGGGNSMLGDSAGKVYLILGRTSGWALGTSLSQANASYLGEGPYDNAGYDVDGRGDVNGDGYDDFMITSIWYTGTFQEQGQAYLVLGKKSGWTKNVVLSSADASFVGSGDYDNLGMDVSMAGDVNGDGCDDLLIPSPGNSDAGTNAGQVYVVFPDHNKPPFSVSSIKVYRDQLYSNSTDQVDMGEKLYIELVGTDTDPANVDVAQVLVNSNSDHYGLRLSLLETGVSTGVFRGTVTVMNKTHESHKWIKGLIGDNVTITSWQDPLQFASVFVGRDDLALLSISPEITLEEGVMSNTSVMVKNNGRRALTGVPVEFQYYPTPGSVKPKTFATRYIDLAVGKTAEVQGFWNTTGHVGNYTIRAIVDPADKYRENNETDNKLETLLHVVPKKPTVLTISTDKQSYDQFEKVRILVHVSVASVTTQVTIDKPMGGHFMYISVPVDNKGDGEKDLTINTSYPLGLYYALVSYNGSLDNTTFRVIDKAPRISSPPNITYTEGMTGNLINWSCSDADPASYNLSSDKGPIKGGKWDGKNISYNVDGLVHGRHWFKLNITDSHGLWTEDTVNVTVNPRPNQKPTVAITSPAPGATVPGQFWVIGTAHDPDGSIVSVQVSIDNGPAKTANGTTSWSYIWDAGTVPDGKHVLVATATDNGGAKANTTVEVHVVSNHAPVLHVLGPAANSEVSVVIGVWGTAQDIDGDNVTVYIKVDDGNWMLANGSTSWRYEWDTMRVPNGGHNISIKAMDEKGLAKVVVLPVLVKNAPGAGTPVTEKPLYSNPVPVTVLATMSIFSIVVVVLSTDVGRWAIFKGIMLPLFSKRKDEAVLDNFIRGWVLGVVVRDPGIRPIDVIETFEGQYSNTLIYYHINELIRFNYLYMVQRDRNGTITGVRKGADRTIVETERGAMAETDLTMKLARLTGMTLHLYPTEVSAPNSQVNLRKKQRFQVYRFIADNPGLSQKEISERLDLSRQALAYQLKELLRDGVLIIGSSGKNKYYYIDKDKKVELRGDIEERAPGQPADKVPGTMAGRDA